RRRRDRARPPAGLLRLPPGGHPAGPARARGVRRGPGPGDHVRGRRPGLRDADRGDPMSEQTPARLDPSAFAALRIEEQDDRLLARLHRPEVRNAIDQAMVDELHAVCAHLEATPKILLLAGTPADPATGAKGVFASGADIAQLRERRRDDALAGINSTVFDRLARLPLPVIASLDGYALGGGAELAYAADFRLGTPALRMGNPETGLGIIAVAGATWRLRELVGEPVAKQILLAGRVLTG